MRLEAFSLKHVMFIVVAVAFAAATLASPARAEEPPPRITEVLPHTVERGVANTFVVAGSGFQPGAAFRLESRGQTTTTIAATSTEVVSGAEIRAVVTISESADLYDVVVRNPDGREAKAEFAVGVAGAQRVIPTLDCVEFDRSRNQLTAYFGYINHNEQTTEVVVGAQNFFAPLPARRTQPIDFNPGVFKRVFSVTFDVTITPHLTWRLYGRGVRAENDPALYCEQSADVKVSQSAQPEGITAGEELTYTLTATNDGPLPATGVVLTDDLPGDVEFVSATPSKGECSGTETVECSVGGLAWGDSASVEIVVRPERAGTFVNTASVRADQRDRNISNNVSTLRTTVAPRAAPVVEGVDPGEGTRGETVPLTISGSGFSGESRAALVRGSIRLGIEDVEANGGGSELTGNLSLPDGLPLGEYTVEVRNSDGQTGVLEEAFSVVALPAPTITNVSPNESLRGRNVNVSIEGENLRDGARVALDGAVRLRASSVSLGPSGNLTARFAIPSSMPPGGYAIEVRNPDGQEAIRNNAFTVAAPTRITLNAGVTSIQPGRTINRSGKLFTPGESAANRRVVLFQRVAETSQFRPVQAVRTNANGAYVFRGLRPNRTVFYQVRFAGNANEGLRASSSPVRRVVVRR